jgi:nitroreductase
MTDLTPRWQARYGAAAAAPSAAGSADLGVIDRLLAHRTVRAFDPRPLPAGTLELLIAAAQSAATSSNLQAWSVVAVEDPARKARLAEWCNHQAHVREAPLFLAWLADLSRLDRTAQRVGQQADANRYLEMFLVAAIDAALAAQNAVVAAESLGLGTVYIGALRNQPERVAEELRLPPRSFAVFGMCIGYPDAARPAAVKPRLDVATVLHRETYRPDAEAAAVQAYDGVIQDFQRSQAMPTVPWSKQSSQRVAGPGSLSGRDRLAQAIRDRGFPLD